MDFKLKRNTYSEDGIFSTLTDTNNQVLFYTLEHAYLQPDGTYEPKIPPGTYTCQRGQHQLHGMIQPFSTFEVTNVRGHVGILFHTGNINSDSDGCILIGSDWGSVNHVTAITGSKVALAKFMALQDGVDSFTLVVE